MNALPLGVYEDLITNALDHRIRAVAPDLVQRSSLDPADAHGLTEQPARRRLVVSKATLVGPLKHVTYLEGGVRAAWCGATRRLAWSASTTTRTSSASAPTTIRKRMRLGFIEAFLATPFSQGERHLRRVAMLTEYETTAAIAGDDTARRQAHPVALDG